MDGYQSQMAQILQVIFKRFNMVEHIPLLSEMCSRMLFISAENFFEISEPKKTMEKKRKYPFFSKEHKTAFQENELICRKWRQAGRPQELSHPARAEKIKSQRKLQDIARKTESSLAIKQH